ncbi:MAG: T9SS type A sorting domain-containing protein [Bacteroidetes bacterium]|nr:T9SS type A sorting domain-containing protein [Bacteroidota bacterium]
MLNRILIISFLLFIFQQSFAQITTDPALPIASNKITVTFDSSKESKLGYFTGELYAHTGVIIEGNTEWQHVIGSWGNNAQPKLTNKGNGIYELEITPDINTFYSVPGNEKVVQLAFVFRSADASKQTNDLFVNVFEDGLVVQITEPNDNAIFVKDQAVNLSARASVSSALKLLLDETTLMQNTGTEISTNYTFTESGEFWLIAEATANNEAVSDSLLIFVREEFISETKPSAYIKGINYPTDTSAALVLWAPLKEFVFVLGDFNDWKPSNEFQMKKDGDFFWLEIPSLEKEKEYVFQYLIDGEIKIADPYTEKIADPGNDKFIENGVYPDLISYPVNKTEGIASVLQPGQEEYQWTVSDFQIPEKEKLVIYELLVRDFTEEHTYKSIIEKLDYLEDLRINVLELMPVNEFEGNNSWGYNPSFYFAPDKYYGPKNELKKLIDECHKRGIAVVMDMVLNHSYGQSPFVQMYMDNWTITPDNPWYNEEHNFQNPDAHWGYDFNHESQATRELVDSINSFWMGKYKIDGFRFDFTKGFSNTSYGSSSWGSSYDAARIANLKRMADEIWKRNVDALVIFEHLADNSEEKELADYGIFLWGNMNHNYGEGAMGYNENSKSDLEWGLYDKRGWAQPNLVTYMESHDEERLTFKCITYGNASGNYNIKELPVALDRMELNSVFHIPLPGPKMIWQFGERGYDVSIDGFGGRLGKKPPRWEYLDNTNRTDLFQVMAKLNDLKQNYEEFTPDIFKYDLTGVIKWYELSKGANHVFAVGNFDIIEQNTDLTFATIGKWYDFFNNDSIEITNLQQSITLTPGEYRLYSTRKFNNPHVITDIDNISVFNENILIYPNPATNEINISSQQAISKVQIYSVTGKLILQTNSGSENIKKINIEGFMPGIYLVKIFMNKTISINKIIVK